MFEKEAEERTEEKYNCNEKEIMPLEAIGYKKGFKDGAEFGYNKAKEEIGDLRDCCNCKHWKYSTRSLSYYCDKTNRIDDCQLQYYRCEHWER